MKTFEFKDSMLGVRKVQADRVEFSGEWVSFWKTDPLNSSRLVPMPDTLVLAEPARRVSHVSEVVEDPTKIPAFQ